MSTACRRLKGRLKGRRGLGSEAGGKGREGTEPGRQVGRCSVDVDASSSIFMFAGGAHPQHPKRARKNKSSVTTTRTQQKPLKGLHLLGEPPAAPTLDEILSVDVGEKNNKEEEKRLDKARSIGSENPGRIFRRKTSSSASDLLGKLWEEGDRTGAGVQRRSPVSSVFRPKSASLSEGKRKEAKENEDTKLIGNKGGRNNTLFGGAASGSPLMCKKLCMSMSFLRKKPNKAGQRRLEQQLHLARTAPDTRVDISDCDLHSIPDGVYALFRVLLKEELLVNSNRLASLKESKQGEEFVKLKDTLRVLDAHNNNLTELPAEIGLMTQLQVLNVSSNRLTKIPDEVGELSRLKTLNVKVSLDVSDNSITVLPKSLAKLRQLENLIVDAHQCAKMRYPPKEICFKGTSAIMKFLCKDEGLNYEPPSKEMTRNKEVPPLVKRQSDGGLVAENRPTAQLASASRSYDKLVQSESEAARYEPFKDTKRRELAVMQQRLLESAEQQAALVSRANRNREEILRQVYEEQQQIDSLISCVRQQKDMERLHLLSVIEQMESHSRNLIGEILKTNKQIRLSEERLEEEEAKKHGTENWFKVKFEEYSRLRRQEIEDAMGSILAQNCSLDGLRLIAERENRRVVEKTLELESGQAASVELVLASRDAAMRRLLDEVTNDQNLQREALLQLMDERDARSSRLNGQIALLHQELQQLSMLERRQADARLAAEQKSLSQQRADVMALLKQLMGEKERRNGELQKRLLEMDRDREDSQVDYWLVQYQKLLDTKPVALLAWEKLAELEISKVLNRAGAEQYLPAFLRHHVTAATLPYLTEDDLQRMGVYEVGVRKAILEAIQDLEAPKKKKAVTTEVSEPKRIPSAPAPPQTVKARFELECVVCMEVKVALVFIPCGHVCCCSRCGESVDDCPLCRAGIEQRVDLCAAAPLSST